MHFKNLHDSGERSILLSSNTHPSIVTTYNQSYTYVSIKVLEQDSIILQCSHLMYVAWYLMHISLQFSCATAHKHTYRRTYIQTHTSYTHLHTPHSTHTHAHTHRCVIHIHICIRTYCTYSICCGITLYCSFSDTHICNYVVEKHDNHSKVWIEAFTIASSLLILTYTKEEWRGSAVKTASCWYGRLWQ